MPQHVYTGASFGAPRPPSVKTMFSIKCPSFERELIIKRENQKPVQSAIETAAVKTGSVSRRVFLNNAPRTTTLHDEKQSNAVLSSDGFSFVVGFVVVGFSSSVVGLFYGRHAI